MNNLYPILAIETSGELCSVCILLNNNYWLEESLYIKHVHSKLLIPIIENLTKRVEINISDIKLIALSEGPGSFTGLRIGYSAAKGLAFGQNIPIVEVPSFEAVAIKFNELNVENKEIKIISNVNVDEFFYYSFININKKYETINELQVIKKIDIGNYAITNENTFSLNQEIKGFNQIVLEARYIGKWASEFSNISDIRNIDYIEPKYFKNFIVR
jgi:tRNA threonylcarbamoyladenosine biosynthesis protein TsaB